MIKRTGVVCVLVALLAGTLLVPADAAEGQAQKVTRKEHVTYQHPSFGSPTIGAACFPCASVFRVSPKERWVRVTVADDASPNPVAFEIIQETPDGRCCVDVGGPYCGTSGRQPVGITPELDVLVHVFASGDLACPGAFGTTGTVTAVFSNAP